MTLASSSSLRLLAIAAVALQNIGAKELGLHPHVSEKYMEHIHLDILRSRVAVIEEEHRSSGGAFHALQEPRKPADGALEPTSPEHAYKHLAIIVVSATDPSRAYVRVLGGSDEETHHPMDEAEQVTAIWVKDSDGVVVHLTEFDAHHEAEQLAHTSLDLAPFQQQKQQAAAEGQPTPTILTPYAVCKNHGVVSIWKGRPFEVPDLPTAVKDEL